LSLFPKIPTHKSKIDLCVGIHPSTAFATILPTDMPTSKKKEKKGRVDIHHIYVLYVITRKGGSDL